MATALVIGNMIGSGIFLLPSIAAIPALSDVEALAAQRAGTIVMPA